MRIKFIDLFAGIGGFRLGMEAAGHEPVGWCEIDKFARKSYKEVYNTDGEWTARDVRKVKPEELPEADCYTAGFPCQSFSVAGKRGGFEDTRGTLFFEIMRLARARKPKYLFLENVKGLLNHNGGATFGTIINTMAELGYSVEWQVLNSKNFGVPQNRERVFIIGHLGKFGGGQVFPIRKVSKRTDEKINKSFAVRNYEKWRKKDDGISNCLDASYYKFPDNHGARTGIIQSGKVRKLTPKECWRLQGFPDWAYERAAEVNSNTQLYKQAGNSVTVNVVYEIAKRLGVDNN